MAVTWEGSESSASTHTTSAHDSSPYRCRCLGVGIRCGSDLGGLPVEREHTHDQCPRLNLMLGWAGLG